MLGERELLHAAAGGDDRAYGLLVDPHRRELHAHCYRMLGSVHDAEDALQDALLRAWRGLRTFEGRSSFRTWLYRIATNSCLRALERRPSRVLPLDAIEAAAVGEPPGRPLVETVWLEPYPDAPDSTYEERESLELAFVAALQHLPPLQRAALILREVLGFSAAETAATLDTTVPAVNSALQRARRTIDERRPARSQQATLAGLGDAGVAELVRRYVEAMESGDVPMVLALLTEEPTWSMPPDSTWYAGIEAVAAFLRDWPLTHRWRHIPTAANGQPAVACYRQDERDGVFRFEALDVLTLEGGRIAAVTAFRTPASFAPFGLPFEVAR